MVAWDDVKRVIVRLRDEQPSPLRQWPDPSYDEHRPPFQIHLAAWAISTAAELLDQFGDDVDLTVGALPFPPSRLRESRRQVVHRADQLDPQLATVELDGPAVVRSGHTLQHGLLLRNLSSGEINLATNGQVTADVVDPETEEVVGGFTGAQLLRLVVFRVAPGETERIPLLIGTESFVPDLGYTVPAGLWGIQTTLRFAPRPMDSQDSVDWRTPVLPLTITDLGP
jgi:hypothetical protein